MYKKTVTYEDYDGVKRTEDFYFNLNKAELIQWLTCNGGFTLDKQLQRLYNMSRGKDIMDVFEDLLRRSYGVKSLDGRQFNKTKEIWEDFRSTEAYSVIFTELVTDAKKAGAFFNSILPKGMISEINEVMKNNKSVIPEELRDYVTTDVLDEKGNLISEEVVKPNNVTPLPTVSPLL